MPAMSQRAYARHRGVALPAVQKAIETGRIYVLVAIVRKRLGLEASLYRRRREGLCAGRTHRLREQTSWWGVVARIGRTAAIHAGKRPNSGDEGSHLRGSMANPACRIVRRY